jgi:opacity protein-like surface antigen
MKNGMTILLAGLAIGLTGVALAPADTHAQRQFGVQPPNTWASVYGLMYTNISGMQDPGSNSRWVFDDNAFGAGLTVQRRLGESLMIGVDGSYARPKFEQRDLVTDLITESGTAAIATLMASGRYGYSGGGDIGFYLTGGIGSVAYKLADLDWNADFALQAGTGLEYRFSPNKALALEWGRTWGYHEKEDLGGGNQTHSALKLALRFGF